jgi:Uma2 family endonuclease
VEVADASYRIDREYKAGLYARAGIAEYWIVDLRRYTVEIHRQPEASPADIFGWRYRTIDVLRPPATVVRSADTMNVSRWRL